MFKKTHEEINRIIDVDPAAPSKFMIYWTYPGVIATRRHRRANWFYRHKMKWIGRIISYRTRKKTGIEIHPNVTIGRRFFIDHGNGVVIGETAIIGDDVTMYQNVTLGADTIEKVPRHPIIGNRVILYPGSSVVGRITVADDTVIGAHAFVNRDTEKGSVMVGTPAKDIKKR